jgi:hypothetical protein
MVEKFKQTFRNDTFGSDFEAIIADSRYKYISKNYLSVLSRNKAAAMVKERTTKSDKADKILTHKIWGIPIFLVILFLIFHLTFSEDLLYLGAMGVFDKKISAYDANGAVVEVTEDTYDDAFSYYDEDGNLAKPVFENGKLISMDAVPCVYLAGGTKITVEDAAAMPDTTPFYADPNGKWKVSVENENGECEAVFVSGIDEYCSGITADTFFGCEDGVYSPGVILFNTLDVFTGLLSTCADEGLADAGLSSTAFWAACLRCFRSCRRFCSCFYSSPYWKTADIWRASRLSSTEYSENSGFRAERLCL